MELENSIKAENLKVFSQEIIQLIFNNQKNKATEKIVKFIENNHYIKSIRNDEKEEIWIYKEGIYLPNGKSYIIEILRKILGNLFTTHFKNLVVTKVQADTFIEADDFFNNQNQHISIIPVQNGLLNIETKELKAFDPEIIFFNKLNVHYKENIDCPNIKQFLKEIVETEEDVNTIQELFGFSMMKEYRFEKAFMFLGNGRNGKGKLLDLHKRFLGIDNCSNVSLQEIENDSFSLCELHNKLVNISGDISKAALENTGQFKSLTGRDLIHAARKFKTRIKFENYAKMIFAANELPRTNDLSEAFFQRWEIINFPYTFYNTIDYEIHKADKYARKRNPDIIQNIISDDELSGLLNWALEGLKRLQDNKLFSSTKNSENVRDTWIRRSDSTASFVTECLQEDYDSFMSWAEIKKHYRDYCMRSGLRSRNDKDLRISLIDNTAANYQIKLVDGKQHRGYSGIKLTSTLFSHNPDKLITYLRENGEASFEALSVVVSSQKELEASLTSLSKEGSIIELPKGTWRIIN